MSLKILTRSHFNYLLRYIRRMSEKSTHTERTAENTRYNEISSATITRMKDESKTVKGLTLKLHDKNVTFKAGQWLDMMISGIDVVGGYSMCSSPIRLKQTGELELAVKYSTHPPAHWIHTQCKEGTEVSIRVGGDFFFDPYTEGPRDLLLIAGGVGINPMFSIVNHLADLQTKGDNSSDMTPQHSSKIVLLYSASSEDELIFKDRLRSIESIHDHIKCQYYVTKDHGKPVTSIPLHTRRIEKEDLEKSLKELNKQTVIYICGPTPMINDMEKLLLSLGIPQTHIRYEKWW